MGISSTAELIWGIPVKGTDEDGEPTEFWSEEDDDWRDDLEGELELVPYGHYEDGERNAILTSTRVEKIIVWCGDEPKRIDTLDLATELNRDKLYSKSSDQARSSGLKTVTSFYGDAGWWLVVSVG